MRKLKLILLPILTLTLSGCAFLEDVFSNSSSSSSSEYTPVPPTSVELLDEYDVSKYYDGYYSSLKSWENGEDLKQQLHEIISKDFNGLTYDDPNWETNQFADQDLYDHTKVDVLYSETDFLKSDTANAGKGWQKEHSFCATLMTGYPTGDSVNIRNSGSSRATDFHNLFAAYGSGNSARGNKNFGEAAPGSTVGSAELGDYVADSDNFEPNDTDKGKLARAIFYMGVMYCEEETSQISSKISYTSNGSSKSKTVTINAKYKPLTIQEEYAHFESLTLSNFCLKTGEWQDGISYESIRKEYVGSTSILDLSRIDETSYVNNFVEGYADYKYETTPFAIGNLSTLLEWNNLPVDRLEMQHNESVYSHVYTNRGVAQNNRNPFVDYPELAEYVYGDKKNSSGELKYLHPTEYILNTGSEAKHSYSLTSYVNTYNVGDSWSVDDIKLIGNTYDFSTFDLSKEEMDYIYENNPDYIFTEKDIGNKEITISSPYGDIKYMVTVSGEAKGLENCNFIHTLTGYSGSGDDFYGYGEKGTDNVYNYADKQNKISLKDESGKSNKDLEMYAYWKNGRIASYSATNGVTFGAQSKGKTNQPCETITFTTIDEINFNSVFISGNTGSGRSYNLKMYVDDEMIYSTTYKRTDETSEYGVVLDKYYQGKLKIEFTNVNGTVIIKAIGVNFYDAVS